MPAIKKVRLVKKCPTCGREFETINKKRIFCSHLCCNRLTSRTRKKMSAETRFWNRVRKGSKHQCWIPSPRPTKTYWTHDGMGAHRYSWILHYGEIPNGLFVCHRCDEPHCVNPNHLFLGSPKDNVQDMISKGRARYAKGLVNGIARQSLENPEIIRGQNNPNSKLTSEQVQAIRNRFTRNGPRSSNLKELSVEFGVCENMISQIVRRKVWQHVT